MKNNFYQLINLENMKVFIRLTFFLLFLPLCLQAQDERVIQKMDSIANSFYDQENYKKCVQVLDKQKELILKNSGDKDTLYFRALCLQASSYYMMDEFDKAISLAKEAKENWEKYHDLNHPDYIILLNSYGMYIGEGKNADHETGLKYGLEALEKYEKLMSRDENLAYILMHVANELSDLGRSSEAVKYQLRAINIFKEIKGEHSVEYMASLDVLAQYYKECGQEQKAKEIDELSTKLADEKEKGIVDLPEFIEFKTVEECRAHTDDAYQYIDYYLSHMLNADKMGQALSYVLGWSMVSDQVHIVIGMEEAKLSSEKTTIPYFAAYMAGCSKYAILADSAEFNRDMFVYSMAHVLDFYASNRVFTGKVEYLEKFLKVLDKKGEDALEALLDKQYEKLMQDIAKVGSKDPLDAEVVKAKEEK